MSEKHHDNNINYSVLVIAYNRPQLLNDLLHLLKSQGVSKVYIALDGPKSSEETSDCAQCYDIASSYKLDMEIKILRNSHNLGCMLGVIRALDWFYSNEEFGLVLEDDCFPTSDFFDFIECYRKNKAVYSNYAPIVTGHNPFVTMESSAVSKYVLVGAWATWNSVWKKLRLNLFRCNLPKRKHLTGAKRSWAAMIFWWTTATRSRLGGLDTWDGMFNDAMWRAGLKCLVPQKNYIENRGFGPSATHSKNPNESNLVYLSGSIKPMLNNNNFDEFLERYYYRIEWHHSITPIFRLFLSFIHNRNKHFERRLLIRDFEISI
jgi:hypothetical protein